MKKEKELTPLTEGVENEEQKQPNADELFKSKARNRIGADGKIGDDYVKKGIETLLRYKNQLASEHQHIIENERWYRLQNWDVIGHNDTGTEKRTTSAWTLNAIANKHADAMDNYPQPNVLPREQSDEKAAKMLSDIIPCILDRRNFEEIYSDLWWYKLKQGTCAVKTYWDSTLENGLGDINIAKVDLLSLFFEATVNDIQDSENIFEVSLMSKDELKASYPFVGDNFDTTKQFLHVKRYDTINNVATDLDDDKAEVIDWYYKKREGSKTVVHYIKFTGNTLLYASENDQRYKDNGYYESGLYPYDFDRMYIKEHSPLGFGCIDVCRSPQEYIDRMDDAMLKYTLVASRPRYFIRNGAGVNVDEFADVSKDIVPFDGNSDDIVPIQVPILPSIYPQIHNNKIDELKENVGNRDFSQGGTTSGVTAASAIASLMEAGSKLSRDIIKASYRTYQQICVKIIELVRQFYDIDRCFRITNDNGKDEYVVFNNQAISGQNKQIGSEIFTSKPYFDIKVSAQRSNPFSITSQNELALQFYQLGFFNPQLADQSLACLDMLEFEGKSKVLQKVQQNGGLYQQLQQAMATIQQLQQMLGMQQQQSMSVAQPLPNGGNADLSHLENNALGRAVRDSKDALVNRAKESAQNAATPNA